MPCFVWRSYNSDKLSSARTSTITSKEAIEKVCCVVPLVCRKLHWLPRKQTESWNH